MKVINLNGEWNVCDAASQEYTYKATVPGDIHNDLINAGVIEAPYYADNSKKCSWVVEKDWKYTKIFNVDSLNKKTYIVFEGIDTVSTIYFNGTKIAETDNMFMQYRLDVTDLISLGENKIEVVIHSIRKELEKYPEDGYFGCFNVQRIFIRKAQCHFSWDWAPDFPATGIWKDVYLETINDTYINDINIKTQPDGNVTFFVNMPETCEYGKEREIEITVEEEIFRFKTTAIKNFFTIKIDNPKLWWSRTLGEPNLYEYKLFAICDYYLSDNTDEHSRHLYDLYKISERITINDSLKELFRIVREERKKRKTCVSAQDGINIRECITEIISKDVFKKDYEAITKPLIFDNVQYETVKKNLKNIVDSDLFI